MRTGTFCGHKRFRSPGWVTGGADPAFWPNECGAYHLTCGLSLTGNVRTTAGHLRSPYGDTERVKALIEKAITVLKACIALLELMRLMFP